jgi:hypothetical protein
MGDATFRHVDSGGETMIFSLFERVVLTEDLLVEGLKAGDVGVIVEHYLAQEGVPEGYEVEFFSASGDTIAVVSVPANSLRKATARDMLSVRELVQV